MKIERPRFELTRVYSDGWKNEPEIIRVSQMPWDTKMERRGFLGVGVGLAALLALSNSACSVELKPRKAHQGRLRILVISPDGTILASGADDETVKLWSLPEGKLLATLAGYGAGTASHELLEISPDGKILASGSHDTVKLWSMPEGKLLTTLEGDKSGINQLAISPDGKILVSGWGVTIKLWSLPEGKLLATLEGNKKVLNALAISPDGKILASGSEDTPVRLWSLPEGKLLATLEGHEKPIIALAISPDGKILASGSDDKTIKLWSFPDGKLLATLVGHKDSVNAVAISLDGKILASPSLDQTIKLWSLPDGKLLATLEAKNLFSVGSWAISPDGKILASSSLDQTIKLWSLPDGKLIHALEGHKGSVNNLAFSPNNKILASGGSLGGNKAGKGEIVIWDLDTKVPLMFLYDPEVVQDEPEAPKCPSHSSSGAGGSYCSCNKVCTCIPVPSDRDLKEAIETTDPRTILLRLSEIPIQKWNYKWDDPSIRHIGPMAQDFAAAFAVGEDDKHIHPVDAQGVAFAAIQGLYRIIQEKEAGTENLLAQLRRQQEENETLSARIEDLERLVKDAAVGGGGRARI